MAAATCTKARECFAEVYESLLTLYRQAGHADWIPFIRNWLRRLDTRILAQYTAGRMEGATDAQVARVRRFFRGLWQETRSE